MKSRVLFQFSAIFFMKGCVRAPWLFILVEKTLPSYIRLVSDLLNASANIGNVHVMRIVLPQNKLALIFILRRECIISVRAGRRFLELIGIQGIVKVSPGGRVWTLVPGQLTSHMR